MKQLKRAGAWSGAVLVAGILLGNNPAYATPISTGELVTNGGFGTFPFPSLAGWTAFGGAGVNARNNINPINLGTGNAGFNSFFGSLSQFNTFAVLGDNNGLTGGNTLLVGGNPSSGISSISQNIDLPTMQGNRKIESYDLDISFRTVFDGRGGSSTAIDTFLASLESFGNTTFREILFTQNSTTLPACATSTSCLSTQLENAPYSRQIHGLLPGTYTLIFSLDEADGGTTNTAAGIDNVSIKGFANPVPEPASLALLGAGLVGLGFMRRRKA